MQWFGTHKNSLLRLVKTKVNMQTRIADILRFQAFGILVSWVQIF